MTDRVDNEISIRKFVEQLEADVSNDTTDVRGALYQLLGFIEATYQIPALTETQVQQVYAQLAGSAE